MISLVAPATPVVYPTAEDVLTHDDRRTFNVRVPWWRQADGTPMTLAIRALSLDDQCATLWTARLVAEQRAKKARVQWDGKADLQTFYLQILLRGIVMPRFSDEHLPRLAKKLGEAVKDLADYIWWLSTVSPTRVDELVAAAAGLSRHPEQPDEPDAEWRSAAELALADSGDL